MRMYLLELENLYVRLAKEDRLILKGVDLKIKPGEVHAIMGPNGSGKSTLAHVIMGNPNYVVVKGEIRYSGEVITDLPPNERAKKGIFLSFQQPPEIPGVRIRSFLSTAYSLTRKNLSLRELEGRMKALAQELGLSPDFLSRYLNLGMSGGERKKSEVIQMGVLDPKLVILDEIDSGLDVDALRQVSKKILELKNPEKSILLITHYSRITSYIVPDVVHVLVDGKIVTSGGPDLISWIEEKGYVEVGTA